MIVNNSASDVIVTATSDAGGDALPNVENLNIIKNGATKCSGDPNEYVNLCLKGGTMIDNNFNTNISNTETQPANNADADAKLIEKFIEASNISADNVTENAHNGENNKNSNDVAPATQNSKKSKYTNFPKKDYSDFVFAHDPLNYFESVLTAYGLVFRNLMEGKIRRCGNQKNPKSDDGWYKYYQNSITTSRGEELIYFYGFYGDWSTGEGTQRINITNFDFENKNYDTEYLKEIKKHAEEAKKKQAEYAAEVEKQIIAEREKAAEKATELFNNCCDDYDCLFTAENPHPYLKNKCLFFDITNANIKVINSKDADAFFGGYRLANKKGKLTDGEWLVIPIYNRNKNGIRSLQFIDNTGNKIMLKGGEAGGGYFEIKSNTDTNKYIISEGVADVLVLNQILPNYNVIVAFSATNLSKVVGDIVKTTPNADIVIFADRDEKSKTGETEAIKAITAHAGKYILPPANIKDFCDFYTIEIQKNSNSDKVISIIRKYINDALIKSFPLFRSIQRVAESKLIFERKNSKDDDKLGKIVATSQNAITALLCPEYCGFDFLFEERSNNIEIIDYVITKKDANGNEILYFDKNTNAKPRPLNDADYSKIKSRLEFHTNNNPTGFQEINTNSILRGVTELVATRKKYNKIKNFINSLPKLSGEKLLKAIDKLDNLFIYYANADVERFPPEYYKIVARCFATQIIARCLTEKGCKADYVPILQGEQGAKKSEFVMSLIHDENLIADVDFDNNTDDIVRKISGKIIGLIDEMNGFGKKQASFVKKFITFKEDTYVPKYKEFPTTIIRSVTFIGTTNEEHFLNDPTGERRYYPIPIFKGKETRFLSLQNDILEIFSAALHLYNEDKKIGNIITPDGKEVVHNGVLYHEMEKWNKVVAGEFKVINPYLHDISNWLNTKFADTKNDFITNKDIKEPDYFKDWQCPKDFEYLIINDVARWALGILPQNYNQRTHGVNITDALFNYGYIKTSKRIKGKVMPVFIRVKTEEDEQNEPENENKKPAENEVDIPF